MLEAGLLLVLAGALLAWLYSLLSLRRPPQPPTPDVTSDPANPLVVADFARWHQHASPSRPVCSNSSFVTKLEAFLRFGGVRQYSKMVVSRHGATLPAPAQSGSTPWRWWPPSQAGGRPAQGTLVPLALAGHTLRRWSPFHCRPTRMPPQRRSCPSSSAGASASATPTSSSSTWSGELRAAWRGPCGPGRAQGLDLKGANNCGKPPITPIRAAAPLKPAPLLCLQLGRGPCRAGVPAPRQGQGSRTSSGTHVRHRPGGCGGVLPLC